MDRLVGLTLTFSDAAVLPVSGVTVSHEPPLLVATKFTGLPETTLTCMVCEAGSAADPIV